MNLGKGIHGILINGTVPNVALLEKESWNNEKQVPTIEYRRS